MSMNPKTTMALTMIESLSPNIHDWLKGEITRLEAANQKLRTGLLLASADEAERTGKLETKYDSYLLPLNTDVTEQEVTPL